MSHVVGHLNPYPTDFMGPLQTVTNYFRDKNSVQIPELVHASYQGVGVCLGTLYPDNHVHSARPSVAIPPTDEAKLEFLESASRQVAANAGAGPALAGALDWKVLLSIFLDLLKQILS